jgi:hypothetical protein
MGEKLAGVTTYLIGIVIMIATMIGLKRKAAEQPAMKLYGFSMRTIFTMCYITIGIFVVFIIAILAGWEKS